MPVVNREATFSVEEDGEGSRVTWTAEFKETESDGDTEKMVRGLIEAGLKALSRYPDNGTIPPLKGMTEPIDSKLVKVAKETKIDAGKHPRPQRGS